MSAPPSIPLINLEGVKRLDVVVRAEWTDGRVSRLTSCRTGFRMPQSFVEDVNGAYYSAVPRITELPQLKQLINGLSDQATLSLSGVPSHVLDIIDGEAETAEGAVIRIGKVYWGARWELLSVVWALVLIGGEVGTQFAAGKRSGGKASPATATISLEAATSQVRRSSSSLSYWTDAQHRMRVSDDRFFEFVGSLSNGLVKAWPKF